MNFINLLVLFDPFYTLLTRELFEDQEEKVLRSLQGLYRIGNFSIDLYGEENVLLKRVVDNVRFTTAIEIGYKNVSDQNLEMYEDLIETYFQV